MEEGNVIVLLLICFCKLPIDSPPTINSLHLFCSAQFTEHLDCLGQIKRTSINTSTVTQRSLEAPTPASLPPPTRRSVRSVKSRFLVNLLATTPKRTKTTFREKCGILETNDLYD